VVAEPGLTSLGGGGFLLARTAAGEEVLFDFFADTPGKGLGEVEPQFEPITIHFVNAEQHFNIGRGSAAVPGTLQGYLHVHRRLGRLDLGEIVRPAVRLAREGVALNASQAYIVKLLAPIFTATPECRALFAPKGEILEGGDRFRNLDYGDYLERLGGDPSATFHRGPLARRIALDMAEGDGLVTEADLAGYRVAERAPLAVDYRGRRLLTNPEPAFGGVLLALELGILAKEDLRGRSRGDLDHLSMLASCFLEVDRTRENDRPDRVGFSRGTTQVSIADREGNVASMTTSNGEGSGYVIPGTGILLNNMLGEEDLHPDGFYAGRPGERVASMMAPSILVDGGRVEMALGSGGSKRIRTALLQVISDVVDFGMDLPRAVNAPRIHWNGSVLQVEPGFETEVVRALGQRWPVNLWRRLDLYFGGVHAVGPGPTGAGDPRREGCARIVDGSR
jgi:gamma-glutamyltranspeptidase/glutathione hydrolase